MGSAARLTLLAVVAVAPVAGALVLLGAAPASAEGHCPPAGGASDQLPDHDPGDADADWVVEGRGWGHGAGMSQHGALGAAMAGCGAATILETYFPGTAVGPLPGAEPGEVRVSLTHAETGAATWDAADVTTRSNAGVSWTTPGGATHLQPAGAAWRLEPVPAESPDAGPWRLVDADGDTVWTGGAPGQRLRAGLDGAPAVSLAQKNGRAYGEGTLRFEIAGDASVHPSVAIGPGARPALDRYLHGLREIPRVWPEAALRAQVIAGRGYAAQRIAANPAGGRGCPDCHLLDSPADQVYAGLSVREDTGGDDWLEAVGATSGQVVRAGGDIATAFYSSSHGGHSESGGFSAALDVSRSYLAAVDDSRWQLAARQGDGRLADPHLTWTREVSDADVRAAVEAATGTDVGEVRRVRTPAPLGAGGRVGVPEDGYGGVVVEGSRAVERLSGWGFVSRLGLRTASGSPGLRSELFQVFPGGLGRLGGTGRVDTAAVAAVDGWGESGTDHAVLATAWDFADALAATALAAQRDAPLLLTPGDALAPRTAATLAQLRAESVTVMGGSAAVAPAVTDELEERGYAVQRVAGATRFSTAAAAARARAGGAGVDEVALAAAGDWPDALAAGALGASDEAMPTLLTTPGSLHPTAAAALADLDAQTVHLVGGTAALAEAVAEELKDSGYDVDRLAGTTRYGTSARVAREVLGRTGRDRVVLASGLTFADALAAGAYSARTEGVLALVARDRLAQSPPIGELLAEGVFASGTLIGGPAAVSDDVRREGARALAR